MNLAVNNLSLALSFSLVVVAMLISSKEKIGLTKDIIVSVLRAIIQLFIVGYLLKFIFKVNNIWLTLAMVLVILFNAALNARQRSNGLPGSFWISLGAIGFSSALSIGVVVWAGAIKLIPAQIVPIFGMIASNAMVANGLAYRTLNALFHDQRQQVLEKLALGATPGQASRSIIQNVIRTSMAPTIDSAKTLGLVSLPGMMSGLMFAGVDPVKAIKYQIMVTFMLLSATSLTAFIATFFAYQTFYNEQQQLVDPFDHVKRPFWQNIFAKKRQA